jgi:hypothetical protein
MMLSRELCEALTEAYPEVQEHRPKPGDVYWVQERPGSPLSPVVVWTEDGMYDFDFWRTETGKYVLPNDFLGASVVSLWCPRLDQLLEIARSKIGEHKAVVLTVGRPGCHSAVQVHDAKGPVIEEGFSGGSTPEEAVARWLLAVAKERVEHGHPS